MTQLRPFESNEGFTFTRSPVTPPARTASLIRELVGTVAMLDITVTVRVGDNDTSFSVKVPKNSNFLFVVLAAVRHYNELAARSPLMKPIPSGEKSGDAESESASVDGRYHIQFRAAADNEKFKVDPQHGLDFKKLIFRFASRPFLITYRETPSFDSSELRVVKVKLPNNKYMTVNGKNSDSLLSVLAHVCATKNLLLSAHTLLYQFNQVSADLTIGELEDPVVTLSQVIDGSGDTLDSESEIFWYESLAEKYKRYNVLHFRKGRKDRRIDKRLQGKNVLRKQKTILGIDKDHITHTYVRSKGNKQYPPFSISDVQSCRLIPLDDVTPPSARYLTSFACCGVSSIGRKFLFVFYDGHSQTYEGPASVARTSC